MLIRHPLLALSISLILSFNLVSAQDQDQGAKKKKPQKRANSPMKQITDVPGLPRILLIGDSISIGYTVATREALKGKANVHRIPTNGGPTTRGLSELDKWLGKGKWDVIHFNWGLHDLKYMDAKGTLTSIEKGKQQVSPDQYAKNLNTLISRLKKTKAKLIFATTTPVVVGTKGRIHGDSKKYNQIALKVMKSQGVAIDDLYSFILPTLKTHQLPKNVHFNRQGSQALGKQVADSIMKELAKDRVKAGN
jgi:acyl-CoA thioesterase-1